MSWVSFVEGLIRTTLKPEKMQSALTQIAILRVLIMELEAQG